MSKYWSLAIVLMAAAVWYYQQHVPGAPPIPTSESALPVMVSLPSVPDQGNSAVRWVIYSSSESDGSTAAGQIFRAPANAPTLMRLGFLFDQDNRSAFLPGFSYQIILSQWQEDRPASNELWASDIRTLPSSAKEVSSTWQDVDVPALMLEADKEYIAWVTLTEVGNLPGVKAMIPDMGPTYRSDPHTDPDAKPIHSYAEGRAAFFREANPAGSRLEMTNFAWVVNKPGSNIAFRMLFSTAH